MGDRTLATAKVLAAAAVLGGVLVAVLPAHAPSVLRLVILTAAAAAALDALQANVPPAGWLSPFQWLSPFRARRGQVGGPGAADEIRALHRQLSGWRRTADGAPAPPPETVRHLTTLATAALGIDPQAEEDAPPAPAGTSATT